MNARTTWDTELYEAQHAFVWKFGAGMIEILAPKPGERVLDVGCGPGQLTHQIAEQGADVLGVDASPDMIGQARQNYPRLRFLLQDATAMTFDGEFDAVFSNAALHWILDAKGAVNSMSRALRKGGRLVLEMGGRGNIRHIEIAIETVLRRHSHVESLPRRQFFPSISEYTSLLEMHGLEVRSALLFDRPTPLEGDEGMGHWLRQFLSFYFDELPSEVRKQALREVVEELRPSLWKGDQWIADYRRLRISAVKL